MLIDYRVHETEATVMYKIGEGLGWIRMFGEGLGVRAIQSYHYIEQ